MTRQAISTDSAPAALGPYSQAIVAGGFVFCSGTAGIDPATGVISGTIQVGATANSPYTVTIQASDGFNMGSASFTWLVDNGSIPSVVAPADQTNFEGDIVSGVTATASNPGDPNPLTFAAANLPAGLSINANTGTYIYKHTHGHANCHLYACRGA